MCDYFTKWPEARAIPQKTAKCVADFVYWTITRNGCPQIQISDQGREFVNQVSKELNERTGISLIRNSLVLMVEVYMCHVGARLCENVSASTGIQFCK